MNGIAILENHGRVIFRQMSKKKVWMKFQFHNFDPKATHAIHIHEFGDTSEGCTSLGGHYNPDNQAHGNLYSKQRHKGDLFNNFTTDKYGNFEAEFVEDNIILSDLFGRSIVIHYLSDDRGLQSIHGIPYNDLSYEILKTLCGERGYAVKGRAECIKKLNQESLITGNAGKRLVCGIIARSQ